MTTAENSSSPSVRHARWRREWLGVSALLALLAFLLGSGSWTWRLDQAVYDIGLSMWPRAAPADIVIVAIDEPSLRQLGRWPWPRVLHATALDRIALARPKAILLDLLLSEPDPDAAQDQALALALQKAGDQVVLPIGFEPLAEHGARALLPVAALRAHARLAHADVELDVDGVLRWTHLYAGIGTERHPHMALGMLQAAGDALHPGIHPQQAPAAKATGPASAWRRDGRLLLRYLGPPGTVQRVSFVDLLRGDVPTTTFKDKFVLIGATAMGLGDGYQTPVSDLSQPMPAVEIAANMLDMLRTGAWIRPAPPVTVGLVSAVLVMALMLAFVQVGPAQALLLTLGSAFGAAAVACVLLRLGLWFAPGTFIVTGLLSYPVWSWRRLETTKQFLDTEIQRLVSASADIGSRPQDRRVPHDEVERRIATIQDANARLLQAQQLLSNTLRALPEAVLVADSDGRLRQANPQLCSLLEAHDPASLLGESLDTLLARWMPTDAPRWAMLLERAMVEDRVVITEVHGPHEQRLLARIAPLAGTPGERSWLVVCLADITPIRLIEQQRDDLLGFIAHDIRSPQASLISLVQLQQLTKAAMPPQEVLAHVDTLARSTLGLCDELLQIMRAEKQPMQLQATDLRQIAVQALSEVELQARIKDIALRQEWPPQPAPILALDPSLVRRALINLLNNAIKFSPRNSQVRLHLTRSEGFWVFAIIDQGPGIKPAELKKLFRRYERLESSTSARMTAGVGLGLVFIDTVARRHGGHVHVHSEEGKGSRFELWLPVS